jgi:hypothetical protein
MRALILQLPLAALAWAQSVPAAQPVIRFATKLAGSNSDAIAGVASDSAGNIYVAGTTSSLDFPTLNALQPKPGGSSFLRVQGGQSSFSLSPLIQQPQRLAASLSRPGLVYAADGKTLKKSTDGGDSWTTVGPFTSFVADVEIDPANPDIVYAAVQDTNSVYRTTDGGATWTVANIGLPTGQNQNAYFIAIDPNAPRHSPVPGEPFARVSFYQSWRYMVADSRRRKLACRHPSLRRRPVRCRLCGDVCPRCQREPDPQEHR